MSQQVYLCAICIRVVFYLIVECEKNGTFNSPFPRTGDLWPYRIHGPTTHTLYTILFC